MTTEAIIKKIKTDAEQQAKKIRSNAENEAKNIKDQAKQQAKQHGQDIIEKGKQQAENRKKIMISQARQQAKRKEMNAKEELIETCFQKALEKLSQMNDHEYKELVKQLIKNGRNQIPGPCTIKISKEIDKTIAEEQGLSVTGNTSASGGVILTSEKGNITVDNTFEGILKREKQRIRVKIGKILFS